MQAKHPSAKNNNQTDKSNFKSKDLDGGSATPLSLPLEGTRKIDDLNMPGLKSGLPARALPVLEGSPYSPPPWEFGGLASLHLLLGNSNLHRAGGVWD